MQRNAIVLSTIVALVVTGCNNLGGPPRRLANNQPVPSANARATAPDLQNSYAVDNAKQLRSSLAASPYQAEPTPPNGGTQYPSTRPGIPVVPASQIADGPAKATAAKHVCDENCGHSHGTVGPDGVIGLPQFRLSELSDEEKLELAKSEITPAQRGVEALPNDNQLESPEVQVTVSPSLPTVETPVTIPVAQPVMIPSAPATVESASMEPAQSAESPPPSSRNVQTASDTGPAESPAAENMLAASSTIRSQGSMHIQVVDSGSAEESNQASTDSMPQLQLPPIQGDLANALRQQTNPRTAAADELNSADLLAPEIIVPPPSEPEVVQSNPEVIPQVAAQIMEAASDSRAKPASSSGIRIDPTLRNPAMTSRATQPQTAPATIQPILRIPAQQQRFNAPAEPVQRNFQTPSASDMLVKPASFEEPADSSTVPAAPKYASCDDCTPAVCVHAECNPNFNCLCNNSPPAMVMRALGGLPWMMATRSFATGSTARAASDVTDPAVQLPVSPKPETRNEARVRTELDQAGQLNQRQMPAGLQAPVAALTTEIVGFGQYERLASKTFQPGQTVLVYCELTGYSSVERPSAGGVEFATTLESRLVVNDASGKTVQQDSFPVLNDTSRSPRNDFYMYVPFKVGNLPPGTYQVMLQIRDANSNNSTIAGPIEFGIR